MDQGIVFGWRTALLLAAWTQLVLLAGALLRTMPNRTANRTLAGLLIVLAGLITPWMIGFAGFYDRWRWLSFVPVAVPLAVSPLAYLYAQSLVNGRWPSGVRKHLFLPGLQFLYLAAAFAFLPEPVKNEWLGRSSAVYNMIVAVLMGCGIVVYGVAGGRLLQDYRYALAAERSDDHRFALRWLARLMLALAVLLLAWSIFSIWDALSPLGYRGLMGLYIIIAAIALFLGIEGWRHSAFPFPRLSRPNGTYGEYEAWTDRAADWAARVREERLYADPELSVRRLAIILATNTAYISRAFNSGLGESFSSHINRLRSEEVASRLEKGDSSDLLAMALEAGFSSKASFNRAFRDSYGCSPSAYRKHHVPEPK